jgi:preprotein translocase subunit SecF
VELIPPNTNYDFLGNRRYAYIFTAVVLTISLLGIPIKGGLKLGIDFKGGAMIQARFNKPVDTEQVRKALSSFGEISVQKFAMSGEEFLIRMDVSDESTGLLGNQVKELLDKSVGQGSTEIRSVEMVGPKVGKDLSESAIWATVIALIFLLVYMAFRFTLTMGLGAIVCLIHDLIVVYGLFVWTGKEFDLTILAAMLTIIGYDVNDTIVVCDRIRDNLKVMRKQPLIEVMNAAINQTLSRTVLTSSFTLLVVISLLVFGTRVLQDFAWALLVGILFGTYSSIFVASPMVLELDRIFPVKR